MSDTTTSSPELPSATKPFLIALACLATCVATLSVAAPKGIVASGLNAALDASALTFEALPSLSEGVDWARVIARPVDTGMSIGAYER